MFRLTALLGLLSLVSSAQPPAPRVAELFAAYQHANTPGCAVGIEAPGQPTLTAAYGMADLEHAVPNTPETVFEVGSVSKRRHVHTRDALEACGLSEFASVYVSNEAQTALTIRVPTGKLVLRRSPDDDFDLKPAERDWFESDLDDLHFIRDASGKISSLSLSGTRVWDFRFERKDGGSTIAQ